MSALPNGPAESLDDLYLTLRPEPLETSEQFRKFYRGEINLVRGEDTVVRLSSRLQQSYGALPFRAFVTGHPGVGKSTEISRLLERVKDQHAGIRLSVANELNPASFKIFDVLLLMLARIAEEADRMNVIPLQGHHSEALIHEITQWFATEQEKSSHTRTSGAEWAAVLRLFVSAKAEMKYAAERKTETVEYKLHRLPDLVDLCNKLIDLSSERLRKKTGKEWLLVVEDLDKSIISAQQLQDLFIQYGAVFRNLRISIIFVIPVWLGYSPEAIRLPGESYMIHDTPVYDRQHNPHEKGRAAVEKVLEARVARSLFDDGQMMRLIVASGGNLRDLFSLVLEAGERARLRNPPSTAIGPEDAKAAINKMRGEYIKRLGQSPYDMQAIPYSAKSARLVGVYHGAPDNEIPDPVAYSLLRARAIQEFNGDIWFGVHPLVVDILKDQRHLRPQDPGGTY